MGRSVDLAGDTITDLAIGERIVFTDVARDGFDFALAGSVLSVAAGQITLDNLAPGARCVAEPLAGGGVALTLALAPVAHDANGDRNSDLVWRSAGGTFSDWLGRADGGFTQNDANASGQVPLDWKVAAIADVNGDGRSDIIWRSASGQFSDWLGRANGGFTSNDANAFVSVSTNWRVAGSGDINGDGRADIVWRNDITGQVSDWLGRADGGFAVNDTAALTAVETRWQIVGVGDFNGDGRADLLWRSANTGQLSDWLGQSNGGFVINDANAQTIAPVDWKVVGTGDFNGDGRGDILWRNARTGQLQRLARQA